MTDWGDGEDEGLAGDFVGIVSARLLAAGLPADERLGALRLLSALDTLADRDDRVRRPLHQVGSEFELPATKIDGWFDALEWVGAVVADEGGILLLGREQPAGSMRLHDFLAVVAEFDAPPARRQTAVAILRPAAAVLVAAAVLAAVLITPGAVRDRRSNDRTNLAAPVAPAKRATAGRTSSDAATSTPETTGTPASITSPAAIAASRGGCPSGAPTIEVLDIVSGTPTSVSGVIRNPTSEPLAVSAFSVIATVQGQDLPAVSGTADTIALPAGESRSWTVAIPATPPTATTVRATVDHWEWQGEAAGCPLP